MNAPGPLAEIIARMREHQLTIIWYHDAATLRAGVPEAITARAR